MTEIPKIEIPKMEINWRLIPTVIKLIYWILQLYYSKQALGVLKLFKVHSHNHDH